MPARTEIPEKAPEELTQTESALYEALWEMTDTYWGVNNADQGDGGSPPGCIRRARAALSAAVRSA